jgi:hypothetical protein
MTSQSPVDTLHIDHGCFSQYIIDLRIPYKYNTFTYNDSAYNKLPYINTIINTILHILYQTSPS